MEVKLSLVFMLLALTMMANKASSFPAEPSWGGLSPFHNVVIETGAVGDYIGEDNEMLLDSEASRRGLARRRTYVGYNALKANAVPCGRRGHSYYNCQKRQRANPYKRGCNAITHCVRYTG